MFNFKRREEVKNSLYARDGNNCGICRKLLGAKSTIDHKIAKSKGGSNRRENLQLAHKLCNRKKGNQ